MGKDVYYVHIYPNAAIDCLSSSSSSAPRRRVVIILKSLITALFSVRVRSSSRSLATTDRRTEIIYLAGNGGAGRR